MLPTGSTLWQCSSVPIVTVAACLVIVESRCACPLLWLAASK